jgi:hypothetical protein
MGKTYIIDVAEEAEADQPKTTKLSLTGTDFGAVSRKGCKKCIFAKLKKDAISCVCDT